MDGDEDDGIIVMTVIRIILNWKIPPSFGFSLWHQFLPVFPFGFG